MALLLVSVGLLAGCQSTTQTETIKIGLVGPFEGMQRALGYETLAAVKLAIRRQNDAGGIGGRPVSLVALNDEGDPAQATKQARKMAVDPAIIGAIGHWSRETTDAALPIYEEAGLPLVIPTAGSFSFPDSSTAQLAPTDQELTDALAAFLTSKGDISRVLLAVEPGQFEVELDSVLREVGIETVLADAGSDSPDVDALILSLGYEETAQFLRERAAPAAILLNDLYLPLVRDLAGNSGIGEIYGWTIAHDERGAKFQEAFIAETGKTPSHQAFMAYDAALCLLQAAADAVESSRGVDLTGISANLRGTSRCGVSKTAHYDAAGRRMPAVIEFHALRP